MHRWIQRPGTLNCLILVMVHCLTGHGNAELSHQSNAEQTSIFENGQHVLTYHAAHITQDGNWGRANYLHPLINPSGQVITEDFPDDHPHHRGVFWAWHQAWLRDRQLGDAWACNGFRWNLNSSRTYHDRKTIVIENDLTWSTIDKTAWIQSSPKPALEKDKANYPELNSIGVESKAETANPVDLIEEKNWIRVHPTHHNCRVIDFFICLSANHEGVRIGGSEDAKGYGGFSVRLKLDGTEAFRSNDREIKPETQAVNAGNWLDVSRLDSGLTIINHPLNPGVQRDQASWILRRKHSMQNAVYPGREPILIPRNQPLRLGYRLVLHDGSLKEEQLSQISASFEQVPQPWSLRSEDQQEEVTFRSRPLRSWFQKRFRSMQNNSID